MSDYEKLSPSEERALSALFDDARAQQDPVSTDFLTRVLADAADVTAEREAMSVAEVSQPDIWTRIGAFFGQLGGLPGASLMTACALFGVSLGYAGPDTLSSLTSLGVTAEASSEFDAQMEVFTTAEFSFDGGELLE